MPHIELFESFQLPTETKMVHILFKVSKIGNNTFEATVLQQNDTSSAPHPSDDPEGALYYVVVVLSVYAFAIVMFIGSFVKKSDKDVGLSSYMRELEKLKNMDKKQEKFRLQLTMLHKDQKHRILGENRALLQTKQSKSAQMVRRSSDSDLRRSGERNALLHPAERETCSSWSLISLDNIDDSLSAISDPKFDFHSPHRTLDVTMSLGLLPSQSGPTLPPSPMSQKSFAPIPEVTIETCE